MHIQVFKFGGAAISHAAGIKNVAGILKKYAGDPLLMVVSAMGKTTNALEGVLENFLKNDPIAVIECYQKVWDYHFSIMDDLFPDKTHVVFGEANALLAGDALLTLAFEWLSRSTPPAPYQASQLILELATA